MTIFDGQTLTLGYWTSITEAFGSPRNITGGGPDVGLPNVLSPLRAKISGNRFTLFNSTENVVTFTIPRYALLRDASGVIPDFRAFDSAITNFNVPTFGPAVVTIQENLIAVKIDAVIFNGHGEAHIDFPLFRGLQCFYGFNFIPFGNAYIAEYIFDNLQLLDFYSVTDYTYNGIAIKAHSLILDNSANSVPIKIVINNRNAYVGSRGIGAFDLHGADSFVISPANDATGIGNVKITLSTAELADNSIAKQLREVGQMP